MIAAVIPARGGSQGVPNKNLAAIGGVSLVGRCVRTCKQCETIDRFYVSSDSRLILLEAMQYGAECIVRPAELASHTATSDSVLMHAIGSIGSGVTVLVQVQCTSPLATAEGIDGTVRTLQESPDLDTVVSVVEFDGLVIERGSQGELHGVGFDFVNPERRRQDRAQRYVISGECWAMNADSFMLRGQVYGGRTGIYQVDHRLEIDSPSDLALARRIYGASEEAVA